MSITTTSTKDSYTGNNATSTPYPITFKYLEDSHITVYVDGVALSDSYYTLTGDGSLGTGQFTTAVAYAGTKKVVVVLDVPFNQPVELLETGALSSSTLEEAYDRLNMQIRRVWRKAQDVLTFSSDEGGAGSTGTADTLVGFDSSGDLGEIPNSTFLSSTSGINDLTDVTITNPSNKEVIEWNGSTWANGVAGATVTSSDTAPPSPVAGDLWFDSTSTQLFVYYTDADSSQWVSAMATTAPLVTTSDTPPTTPVSGDLWFNSNMSQMFVYYTDVNSSQWVTISAGSPTVQGDVVSVKDFGAVGDGVTDDTTAIQATIDYAVANSKVAYLPEGDYKISSTIRNTATASNFGFVGSGIGTTTISCYFGSSQSCVKFFNKTNFTLSGFSVNGRFSSGSLSTQGVDCAHLTNATISDISVQDVEGQGIWCISGANSITNNEVIMTRLRVKDCGSSGIQLSGARQSSLSHSIAENCGSLYATNGGSGSGVYFKCPIEDCIHTGNTAINVALGAFNLGNSYAGVAKGKRLNFSNGTAINCKRGIRAGDIEDSVFTNFTLDLDGTNTDGLGDGVRLEAGAINNSVTNISVSGVGSGRAGARLIDGAVGNFIELTSFKNPTAGAYVASFGNTSEDNIVEVTNNKSASSEVLYGTDTSNIYRRKGVPNAQQKTISSGAISLEDREVCYVILDTESSAATDDLDTINGAQYDGQILRLTSYSDIRDVTVKDSTGNLRLEGDMVLDRASDTITLMWVGRVSQWCEVSRSNNQS
jgi:hypothetical protein